jgi:hypothetical protein
MKVKISQAARQIAAAIKAKLVVMLKGSPALGKSAIVKQIAAEYNLYVIDMRLSQCDPTDLAGFPTIDGHKADYLPMKHFPIVGDPLPINPDTGVRYAGWLLFLDEATSAPPAIQAAAYKLVLDRMVGSHHLHKNVAIVLAGNLETDGAIVHPMSTALQSRLVHLELEVDADEFVAWAEANGIDYRITGYIKFKPKNVYTFSPDHTDCTYASPRTWEFAHRLLGVMDHTDRDFLPLLAGTLSEGVAREFISFCKIHDELLKPSQIVADPERVRVPTEPSVLFALTGSIAHNIKPDTGEAYMKFVSRLPVEFQVVCLRETIRRNKAMMAHPLIQKWIAKSAATLF